MFKLKSTVLLLFSCVLLCGGYQGGDRFKIGALFNLKSSDAELAFKYAVQWHNIYSSEGTFYDMDIQNVPPKNIFSTSKIVCNITKTRPGVIAIFGPEALRTAAITQSICKKLEIPHIQTTWQPSTSYPPLISLNFYPSADLLAQGFATIVRHMNWKSYAIVYQKDEALIRLQEILKIPDVSDNPVTVRQLEYGSDYRQMLKGIKEAGVQKIILDCETDDIINILQQAKDVELLNYPISYLLTSLDAHTLDYTSLNTTANITMVRLFDPLGDNLTRNIQSWEVGEMRGNRHINVTAGTVRTEAVLMIDAVNLLIETVNHLHKTQKIQARSMDCEDTDTWEGGYRIAAYMKEHKLAHPLTGQIGFDEFGRRINFTLHVLELNADIIKATWSPENGTNLNITISATERRQLMLSSLQKQKVVVSTKLGNPYFMLRNKSHSSSDATSPYEGYVVDLIERISQEINFTYEFHLADANGNFDENSQTWSGVIGDVVNGVAQLGICDLTVTHQRRKYVDFSNHFMTLGAFLLQHKLAHPLTGQIGFDEFGRRINFTLHVLELNADIIKATWSPENGTNLNITISATERRQLMLSSLQKQKVVVSTKLGNPYFMLRNKSHSSSDATSPYEGYVVDLIERISQEINFTYEFHLADANGNFDENSQTWSGVIGDVVNGVAQLGICDLTVTHQRRKYVDFSNHFMTLGISILYKKPQIGETNMFAFMGPLAEDVWFYTATAYLGVSVLLYLIARMAPGDWENPHPCDDNPKELENIWNLGNSLWLTMGSIMTQGCDILPKGVSSRMAVSMWWFFSLLMTSSYTANLAAYLSRERMGPQINSVDGLINQNKIKFGTMINGSTYQFFQTSNYTKYVAVWNKMNNFKPSTFVKENSEGVRKVRNKNQDYAFFMESSSMEYEINKYQCELKQIGQLLDSKGYGIAMPIDAPYRAEINDAILKFQESGYLQTLKDRWWKEFKTGEEPVCDSSDSGSSDGSLTLANVGGVFLVLAIGVVVSFLIAVVEFLWNVKNISVEEHVTYWEAFKMELKFATNFWVTKKAARAEVKEPSRSRDVSETRSIAEKVLQGAGSFLRLENMFERMSVNRND